MYITVTQFYADIGIQKIARNSFHTHADEYHIYWSNFFCVDIPMKIHLVKCKRINLKLHSDYSNLMYLDCLGEKTSFLTICQYT